MLLVKALVTGALLRLSGSRRGRRRGDRPADGIPSETTLIVLGAAAAAGVIAPDTGDLLAGGTAIGLTVTPLLAKLGRLAARRVDRRAAEAARTMTQPTGRTIIFGFGRVGRMVADMLAEHSKPYLAVDSDIDTVIAARQAGYDDPVRRRRAPRTGRAAEARPRRRAGPDDGRSRCWSRSSPGACAAGSPDLPIIARARDTDHAAELYKAGVTDAVPETLEASLQLSEAVLVDIGVAMGPVIASIHEKRVELRAEIMAQAEMEAEPRLGRRRLRDAGPAA